MPDNFVLLYFVIIFKLFILDSCAQGQMTAALNRYNTAYDFLEANDNSKDLSDYLDNIDTINSAKYEDDANNELRALVPEQRNINDIDVKAEDNNLLLQPLNEEEKALRAAVDETQNAIDHVTGLIKSMREHAIALIKDMNQLEQDFLGSNSSAACVYATGESDNTASTASNGKDADNNGNNKSNEKDNDNKNGQNNNNNNNHDNDTNEDDLHNNKTTPIECFAKTHIKANINGATAMPAFVMNEFGAPLKTDLMSEAQDAVRSWKAQIDECKRILDAAVSQAVQYTPQALVQSQSPLKQQQLRKQHFSGIAPTKQTTAAATATAAPPIATDSQVHKQHIYGKGGMPDIAPAAAASLTPTVVNASNSAGDMLGKEKMIGNFAADEHDIKYSCNDAKRLRTNPARRSAHRQRKYVGKYDMLKRAKDNNNLWSFKIN